MGTKVLSRLSYAEIGAVLAISLVVEHSALAQTVPTDLLDLSIEDLFDANVVSEADRAETRRKWHLSYTYAISEYEEYYLGTNRVSYDDVLFSPGVDARTDNNYPVVPTEITQEVHALRLGYDLTEALTVRAQLPFVMQSTDHISIILRLRRVQYQLGGGGGYCVGAGFHDPSDAEQQLEDWCGPQHADGLH